MEALTLVGTFVAASVWMMRYSMQQQRSIAERFIQHLERMVEKQESENRLNRSAVRQLIGAVRRNSRLLQKQTIAPSGDAGQKKDEKSAS